MFKRFDVGGRKKYHYSLAGVEKGKFTFQIYKLFLNASVYKFRIRITLRVPKTKTVFELFLKFSNYVTG